MSSPIIREVTIGDCRLIQGDCLDVIPLLGEFDAVVTDPPYGIGFKYNSHNDSDLLLYSKMIKALADKPLALLQYPEEFIRLCVPELGPPDNIMAWVYNSNLPRQTRLWGFWGLDFDCSRSKQAAKNPECAKVANDFVSGYNWRNIPQCKNVSKDKTSHPCQLPVGVANWVLECVRAETILDPFMGSGTTGVACVKLGRKFTGIELDSEYFDIAVERIRKAYEQPDMFVEAEKSKPAEQTTIDFGEDAA